MPGNGARVFVQKWGKMESQNCISSRESRRKKKLEKQWKEVLDRLPEATGRSKDLATAALWLSLWVEAPGHLCRRKEDAGRQALCRGDLEGQHKHAMFRRDTLNRGAPNGLCQVTFGARCGGSHTWEASLQDGIAAFVWVLSSPGPDSSSSSSSQNEANQHK